MEPINTEQTFDMLPHVVSIYEKLDVEEFIEETRKKNKGKDINIEKAGMSFIVYLGKNFDKAKDDVFNILSIAERKDVEEVKTQALSETLNSLKAIFLDKDLMDFFKEAML